MTALETPRPQTVALADPGEIPTINISPSVWVTPNHVVGPQKATHRISQFWTNWTPNQNPSQIPKCIIFDIHLTLTTELSLLTAILRSPTVFLRCGERALSFSFLPCAGAASPLQGLPCNSGCFCPLACSVCSWHSGHGCNVLLVLSSAITLALQEPHRRNSSHGHSPLHTSTDSTWTVLNPCTKHCG